MRKGIFGGLALTLGLFSLGSAQQDTVRGGPGLSVLGILSVPTGDYADEREGLATLGFGAGIEYLFPLQSSPGWGVVLGGYFIHNPMDFAELEGDGDFFEGGGYNHVTLMGGARLGDLGGIAGLYLQAMAGLNLASIGDMEIESDDRYTLTWSSATSFAVSVGAGRKFGRFDVGLRYLNFGEPEFKSKLKDEDGYTLNSGKGKQEISMLAFTVGYSF